VKHPSFLVNGWGLRCKFLGYLALASRAKGYGSRIAPFTYANFADADSGRFLHRRLLTFKWPYWLTVALSKITTVFPMYCRVVVGIASDLQIERFVLTARPPQLFGTLALIQAFEPKLVPLSFCAANRPFRIHSNDLFAILTERDRLFLTGYPSRQM
jgi:hypothetical protein